MTMTMMMMMEVEGADVVPVFQRTSGKCGQRWNS
jgi:hypothetical protein